VRRRVEGSVQWSSVTSRVSNFYMLYDHSACLLFMPSPHFLISCDWVMLQRRTCCTPGRWGLTRA
jgi:hypothetical protein